jgi:predicted HicB family RNase H-like nuclease
MSKPLADQCSDPTQDITIRIPCRLAERVAAFAADNNTSVASVVIEALDFFLREQMPH